MAKAKRPDISPSRKTQRERTEKNKRAALARHERKVTARRTKVAARLGMTVKELVLAREEHREEFKRSFPERRAAAIRRTRLIIEQSLEAAKRDGLIYFPGMNPAPVVPAPKAQKTNTKQRRVQAR